MTTSTMPITENTMMALGDIIYHGTQAKTPGPGIITIEQPDGTPIGVVAHIRKHSHGGYSWGYEGSGPADAARSLMLAALGDDAKCPCAGKTRCDRQCDNGYTRIPYQMFKFAVLANAPDEWRIWRSWVIDWINRAQGNITMMTTRFTPSGWPVE